ncbi:MAG: tetratricopeptide repeat protein [Chitinophagaceae bacterium]
MDRITTLKNFLANTPDDSFLQHALALEYIKLNDDQEARIVFERILSKDPSYIGSYYHLGKLMERLGETEQAISVFENGMLVAKELKDQHAFNELKAACDDLI